MAGLYQALTSSGPMSGNDAFMGRWKAIGFIAAAMLGFASAALGQDDEALETARRLVVLSGAPTQFRSFPAQIEADIARNGAQLDSSQRAGLVKAWSEAFRPDVLQEDATKRLARRLDVKDMQSAITWLETDVGRRVTEAEERASGGLGEQLGAFVEEQKRTQRNPAREKLLEDLLAASGGVQVAVTTAEAVALGMAIGMDSLLPREQQMGLERLRLALRHKIPRGMLTAMLAEQLPVMLAYAYRQISDADLAEYLRFMRSAAGKRYQEAMNASLTETLAWGAIRVGERFGKGSLPSV